MIHKESYLVYNSKTDTLELNNEEHALISELQMSPSFKHERILKRFFDASDNRKVSLERMEEIVQFYYNSIQSFPATRIVVPFLTKTNELINIIKTIDALIESFEKTPKERKTSGPQQKSIALSITYRQLGGSVSHWPKGEIKRNIDTVAKEFGVSSDKLQKCYRQFQEGKSDIRIKYLQKEKNRNEILTLLGDDEKAILELKRDLDKMNGPV